MDLDIIVILPEINKDRKKLLHNTYVGCARIFEILIDLKIKKMLYLLKHTFNLFTKLRILTLYFGRFPSSKESMYNRAHTRYQSAV